MGTIENDYYSNLELLFIVKNCNSFSEIIEACLIIQSLKEEGFQINTLLFLRFCKRRIEQIDSNVSRKKR